MQRKKRRRPSPAKGVKLPPAEEVVATQGERRLTKDGKKVWTLAEQRAQEQAVGTLLTRPNVSPRDIVYVMRERYGVGQKRTEDLIRRIRVAWKEEDEAARASYKSAAVRRISQALEWARGERTDDGRAWKVEPDHKAIIGYENLLAKIQGTFEPLRVAVDVRVSQALVPAISGLTEDQIAEYVAEYQDMQKMAEAYRATTTVLQLPEGTAE